MSLRTRTLLFVGLTILVAVTALYVLIRIVLLDGFHDLEMRTGLENVTRIVNALEHDLDDLNTLTYDYSAWDDSYAFIQDGNSDFIESNLVESAFITTNLTVVVFMDLDGQIVFGTGFDLEKGAFTALPQGIHDHLTPDRLLNLPDIDSYLTGMVMVGENPLLVSAHPIITSDLEGPMRGVLIMGRCLDERAVRALAERTKTDLTLFLVDDSALDSALPDAVRVVQPSLSSETPTAVRAVNADTIAGYTLLNDLYGKAVWVLKADMPREIYHQGQSTLRYLVAVIVVMGLITGAVAVLILETAVMRRLGQLTQGVLAVGRSGNRSTRVPALRGNDEVSQLVDAINDTFAKLEKSESQREQHAILLKEIHHRVNNNLQVISSLLGLQSYQLEDQDLIDVLSESQSRVQVMALVHKKLYSSEDLNRISLREYIQDLVTQLRGSLSISQNTRLDVTAADLAVTIDKALPVGMIINELVSNAIKYAYPDEQEGQVSIDLAVRDEGMLAVQVADSGIGLPDDIDLDNPQTLGLQLVNMLSKQLDGKIQRKEGPGTTIEVLVPL